MIQLFPDSQRGQFHCCFECAGVRCGSSTLDKSKVVVGRDRRASFTCLLVDVGAARATTARPATATMRCSFRVGRSLNSSVDVLVCGTFRCRQRIQHGSVRAACLVNQWMDFETILIPCWPRSSNKWLASRYTTSDPLES